MNEIKIEDYLHLYFNNENLMFECIGDYENTEIARMTNADNKGVWLATKYRPLLPNSGVYRKYKDIKPILRPLSDMTEEEMKEFVLIDLNIKNTLKKVSLVFEATKIYYETTGLVGNGHMDLIRCSSDQFFYLLKQGFDLFGLIPKKLAINNLTVTSKD